MSVNKQAVDILDDVNNLVKQNKLKKVTRAALCRSNNKSFSEHKIRCAFGSFAKFKESLRERFPEEIAYKRKSDIQEKSNKNHTKECKYIYNDTTGDYVFDFTDVANIGKVITLKNTQVYAIIQDYSNFDKSPKTVNDIAIRHRIPGFVLKKVLHALSCTHDSLPITDELVEQQDGDSIVNELIQLRKFNIFEKFNHLSWKDIQANSDKWIQFEQGVLDPLKAIVDNYKSPECNVKRGPLEPKGVIDYSKTYVVTLSDWHFGCYGDKNNMFYAEEDWTIEKTLQNVDKYIQQIQSDIGSRVNVPGKVLILSVGDILDSLSGFTSHGTRLNTNPKGITQFNIALEAIDYFIRSLIQLFPEDTEFALRSVSGNHDAIGDYLLFNTFKHIFKGEVDCEIETSRWSMFQIGANLFVAEHGYSANYPSKVPNSDTAKENYVQKLIIEKMSEFKQPIRNRYFIMGDRHHYSQKVMSSFEFIQLPTWVEHDEYADNLNLHNRPRQIAMLIDDDDGIIQTINFYFD